jgi:hypothetical protein
MAFGADLLRQGAALLQIAEFLRARLGRRKRRPESHDAQI